VGIAETRQKLNRMVKRDKQTGVVTIPLCSVCEYTKLSHWLTASIIQRSPSFFDNFDKKRKRFTITCIWRKKIL